MSNPDQPIQNYLPSASKVRVLIADDSRVEREVMKALLNRLGIFEIIEAEDGHQAEMKIWTAVHAKIPFDLLLLDWMMPRVDGLKLVKAIRADKEMAGSKIIMFTGVTIDTQVKEALHAGVNAYLIKPIEIRTLQEKIVKLLDLPIR